MTYLDALDVDQVTREKLEQLAAPDAVALLALFDATDRGTLARFLGRETVANVRSQLVRLVGDSAPPPRSTRAFTLGARAGIPPARVARTDVTNRRDAIHDRIATLRKQELSREQCRELESLERELDQLLEAM